MSFNNVYYKRTTATPKACYVCYKPTTTVLATINTVDFMYTCPVHLTDRGFATVLGGEEGSGGGKLSEEEIQKVKEEWEEKQRRKKEKEKEEKEKEEKEEKDKDKSKEKEESKAVVVKPVHERYALHRDFFAMRQGEHRKRRQVVQAKELGPRLPGAPLGMIE